MSRIALFARNPGETPKEHPENNMSDDTLTLLKATGLFECLDLHFARLMAELAGKTPGDHGAPVILASALLCRNQRLGHVCLPLDRAAEALGPSGGLAEADSLASPGLGVRSMPPELTLPDPAQWRKALLRGGVAGRPGEFTPLILDDRDRLYLHRYWRYEHRLARFILDRRAEERGERSGEGSAPSLDADRLADGMARLFPPRPGGVEDQAVAALAALTRSFLVISGGPGTGKTTTVARILALLLEQGVAPDRIAMAAPTGKAAARLRAAIVREKARLDSPLAPAIPEEALTLHRLLGAGPHGGDFRHHEGNPLPADVVVVDEASMVDLALMSRLAAVLRPGCRLILLGDKDQLASVEAGAVLGDICHGASAIGDRDGAVPFRELVSRICGHPLEKNAPVPGMIGNDVARLRENHRFGTDSGIGRLSRRIGDGDGAGAEALLREGGYADLAWESFPPSPSPEDLAGRLGPAIREGFGPFPDVLEDPGEAFRRFEGFRILCGPRRGPVGVEGLNRLVEGLLAAMGKIRPRRGSDWYAGRPVMVVRNDYATGLFNGDVGLTLPDPGDGGRLKVFFPTGEGDFRRLSPARMPAHDTVFAMTVHKSQGSEFGRVLFLPPGPDSPLLTRELFYTGVTRAASRLEIRADAAMARLAAERPTRRASGLRDALNDDGR